VAANREKTPAYGFDSPVPRLRHAFSCRQDHKTGLVESLVHVLVRPLCKALDVGYDVNVVAGKGWKHVFQVVSVHGVAVPQQLLVNPWVLLRLFVWVWNQD